MCVCVCAWTEDAFVGSGVCLCECDVCVSVCFCGSVVCENFFAVCVHACGCVGRVGADCVSECEYVSSNGQTRRIPP